MPEWAWLLIVVALTALITWAWRPGPRRLSEYEDDR